MGESPLKLIMWRSGTFPEKTTSETTLPITNMNYGTTKGLTAGSLGDVLGFRKLLYSCTEERCHSSTHPPYIQLHHCMLSVYQAFPHVSTASDKCWGEKAWVQGYAVPRTWLTECSWQYHRMKPAWNISLFGRLLGAQGLNASTPHSRRVYSNCGNNMRFLSL